jgi:hypothetical protein
MFSLQRKERFFVRFKRDELIPPFRGPTDLLTIDIGPFLNHGMTF